MSGRLATAALSALLLCGCPHDFTRQQRDGADACVPTNNGVERCDSTDNDCDGKVDEDPGTLCKLNNATASCSKGTCSITACNIGHFNNDGKPDNGCEYPCKVSAGGHEVCNDNKDNDCDGKTDAADDCESLVTYYGFGDSDTIKNWPTIVDISGGDNDAAGKNGLKKICEAPGGVPGLDSDGCAAGFDGLGAHMLVPLTPKQNLISCDSTTGWSAHGGVTLETTEVKLGNAVRVSGKSDNYNLFASVKVSLDVSKWVKEPQKDNSPDGYLVFWIFIQDAAYSTIHGIEFGQANNANSANWFGDKAASPKFGDIGKHVINPARGTFVSGWNLVALPFAAATYQGKATIDWKKIAFIQFYSTVRNDDTSNSFIFDQFHILRDLDQFYWRFTVMLWARPLSTGTMKYLFHKYDDSPGIRIAGNRCSFLTDGKGSGCVDSTVTVSLDKWTLLVTTFDGKLLKGYVDGVKQGETVATFGPGERTMLGGDGVPGRYFHGYIDDVAVYDRALSTDEISKYYRFFSPQ